MSGSFSTGYGEGVAAASAAAHSGEMGVYDHMMRPSMGHKLQVDLRHSMERYHDNKELLKQHFGELRFGSRELHTSPIPPPPPDPPMKKWGDPRSKFSQAPEMAAQKARLAQLQHENSHLTREHTEPRTNNSILPPIQDSATHNKTKNAKPDENPAQRKPKQETDVTQKTTAPKAGLQSKKVEVTKSRKLQKKRVKKPVQPKDKLLPVLKLPTIYSASERRSVWDSGHNHVHLQGPSTHLEKNQVDEDCRNFKHSSVTIPPAMDAKRTEIQRPMWMQQTGVGTKVQFRRHPPHAPAAPDKHIAAHSTPADPHLTQQPTVDHFPHDAIRLPELDDDSTEGEGSEDEVEEPPNTDQAQRTTLPAIPTSKPTKLSDHNLPAAHTVPNLRLQRGMTPSAVSTATAQSGATGATYMSMMSQEVKAWKGAYMNSDDPHLKGRMLMEILHATRQRMQDNEEDLRLSGDPHQSDSWSMGGRSDVMLLHRDSTTLDSGANTARSSVHQPKLLKLPRYNKKRAAGRQDSQNAKLHRYLNKLTNQRKAGEQRPQEQRRRQAPFPLATMTIKELTQTSLEHHSAVQTAS